jgi:hypothetical protein
MSKYAKAYAAAVTAVLAALNIIYAAAVDGAVTAKDYVAAGIALITAVTVYLVPNKPAEDMAVMVQAGLAQSDPEPPVSG